MPDQTWVDGHGIDWSTAEILDSAVRAMPEAQQSQIATEFIRALARDCFAELRFEGEITSAAIDWLVSYIELMKPIWAAEE